MSDFENDLRRTVRRREPPQDLAPEIMRRIGGAPQRSSRFRWFWDWRPAMAAAAAALMLTVGVEQYREYRRAQEAKQQLMLALQITGQKLSLVQEKVDRLSRRSIGHEH
jgi:hypothetical protein